MRDITNGIQQDAAERAGIAILDHDCNYLYVNPQLAAYHGRSVAEYHQRHLSELVPQHILDVVAPLYSYVVRTRLPIVSIEFYTRAHCADRAITHWLASYVPISEGIQATVLRLSPSKIEWRSAHSATEWSTMYKLTRAEHSIVEHLARGLSTKKIAAILGVSTYTIATHRKNICKKLDLHSSSELIAFAAMLAPMSRPGVATEFARTR